MKECKILFLLFFIFILSSQLHAVVLTPDPNNPNASQDIPYQWQPGMEISFQGAEVAGYQFVGLINKTQTGTWSGNTWFPPLEAVTVNVICTGKWVPVGGGPGPGPPPPILYCAAINKGKFPDHIEWMKPSQKTYIQAGDGVDLEIDVKDQNGDSISGYNIDWTLNGGGGYFEIDRKSGYTAHLTSASDTPPGTTVTVTAKIQSTDISATSAEIVVVGVEITGVVDHPLDTEYTKLNLVVSGWAKPPGEYLLCQASANSPSDVTPDSISNSISATSDENWTLILATFYAEGGNPTLLGEIFVIDATYAEIAHDSIKHTVGE